MPKQRPPKHNTAKRPDDMGSLRIIGGSWRGRKLQFPLSEGLRPTGDRIRETLFNWLAPTIEGARCLDLFAGSGALGLEALSRGAASCTFVENAHSAAEVIRQHLQKLDANGGDVSQMSALRWLENSTENFDIIFLDPPFSAGLHAPAIELIEQKHILKPGGQLYIEFDLKQRPELPASLTLEKDKKAGKTGYQLWRQS